MSNNIKPYLICTLSGKGLNPPTGIALSGFDIV
jgi:hypothetical protein